LRASKNLLGFFSVARGHLIKCKKLTSLSKNACGGKHFISQKALSLITFISTLSTLRWVKRLSKYSSLGRGGSYNRAHL
jgi:hypothetical protein